MGCRCLATSFSAVDDGATCPDDVPRLKLKWAFGYPGAVRAFAQPTIVAGRLFVGSQNGKVYSLAADSGCTYWEFNTEKPVLQRLSSASEPTAGQSISATSAPRSMPLT
jgi:outer membrane protein assembly factor BamB